MKKYTISGGTIKLRLKNLSPLIRAGKGYAYSSPIVWRNGYGEEQLSLSVKFYKDYTGGDNTGYVLGLRWRTPDGRTGEQDICLAKRESNLGSGEVWYFVCNYTEHLCRTLYYVGGRFYSRWALPHIYAHQKMSRQQRVLRFVEEDIPSIDGRKLTYRGKPTPIGRKYEQMIGKVERAEEAVTDILMHPKRIRV